VRVNVLYHAQRGQQILSLGSNGLWVARFERLREVLVLRLQVDLQLGSAGRVLRQPTARRRRLWLLTTAF